MSGIVIATLVLAVCGVAVGVGLVFTGRKFYVEVDERETAVRECLPGNNCGACGFAVRSWELPPKRRTEKSRLCAARELAT